MSTPAAKVLVIDDEIGPRESLRMLLKNEFQVHLADGVTEGLRVLKEENPDVVLLDIGLPDTDGLSLIAEVRRTHPESAVVMLTASDDVPTVVRAMQLGASDYLPKPLTRARLR